MLHIAADTSRTVAFRKTSTGYQWIGEQEIHTGPKTYKSVDGTFHEEICITYETVPLSGAPLDKVFVTYLGPDNRLANRLNLTLADVKPVLAEWKKAHHD